jgi:thiamine biosynthesis lipoprotein
VNAEAHLGFACFGGTVSIHVRGADEADGERLAERGRGILLDAHRRLSRFDPDSELSRLNNDPRAAVPASPLLRRLAAAVPFAVAESGGLVDATLVDEIERAGYAESLEPSDLPPARSAPGEERPPARPHPDAAWRTVSVDEEAGTVQRPPGLKIDSGGIAKGLLADIVGEQLGATRTYAVDCCGDIRLGGSARLARKLRVEDPFGGEPLHELSLYNGAVATSGITRRRWRGPGGQPAHQILDPRSGSPAFTGVVQATAVAPNALLAEVLAKAALLSGPERAARWLRFGGVVVDEGGEVAVVAAQRPLAAAA